MAKYTEHLKLVKPEGNEYYNVEQFNHNSELIDKETKKLNDGLTKVQEGATREKAGIVQLGTEEGKALEGMMLARLAGCIGYGGDIQDDIVKNPNYIYYDRNTRKMYKCLKQNQDISANVANFIPLDNNSLLERLENLSKTKINITVNVPKNLLELNALANTLLKFSNQDSFSGLKNFEILAKDGTFFMRISKTPSFYIFEIFLQVSKYFIGTWYRDSELIFVQIS